MTVTDRFLFPRRVGPILVVGVLTAGAGLLLAQRSYADDVRPVPEAVVDEPATSGSETAILAGGCFWGVQGVYQHVEGVKSAVSGYAGGAGSTAHYDEVSTGTTGHAEAVKVTFDPHRISYGRILQIYFSAVHNPTELNRQGPDTGTQYRSAIFPTDAEQARVANAYKDQLNAAHVFDAAIVTKIEPGQSFYPAEAHHQDFLALHPSYPYIAVNDMPKVAALQRLYPSLYRGDPILVSAATD